MTKYRGDNIPSVSDYSHWNEDAELMWYQENKYDMEHYDEVLEDDDDRDYDNWLEEILPCDECGGEEDHYDDCAFVR